MKSIIVGTAGHIDHGKTALVRALTGIDTDRLAEEKRRGITIELGFAHLALEGAGGPLRLGFVDVPGHERFVHTMLAGVCGVDVVLFVISAQESIKPQTREHFEICRLLGVKRGLIALTKCDLVDDVTLDVVRMEVAELVQESFLEGAPMIAVSARTGEGLEFLRAELARLAGDCDPKDARAPFRLPIDRVFTIKGFGTVVTGTLIAGTVQPEQEVELSDGRKLRVRGVQAHGEACARAVAGQRTAINLASIAPDELARGMMLAEPGLMRPGARLDVRVTLAADAPDVKTGARVHVSLFTRETVARLRFLGNVATLRAGESVWARLYLESPVVAAPGDRFIIRRFSPVVTIGGGTVADVSPMRRAKPAERLRLLEEFSSGDDLRCLGALVGRRGRHGLSRADARVETGWDKDRLHAAAEKLSRAKVLSRIGELLVETSAFERAVRDIFAAIRIFGAANPLSGGANRQEMLSRSGLDREIFAAALGSLLAAKKLEAAGDLLCLPGQHLREEETQSRQQIKDAFARAGVRAPALGEVLASLTIDRKRAENLVTLLLREKVLISIQPDFLVHRDALKAMKDNVRAMKAASPRMDVARFKETFGLSRKYAIPLLEYLDREGVTKRAGDERIIQ